ncbi:glycogen debranching enzyme-like [Babylonia areolata]|uniref:glycogen debranching enzyme-like n=1 Tax=Babylonia areolata TaxID=304850 RepID=UPI003FD16A31
MENRQVRILHLKKGDDKKSDVHRLQKGQVLRFLQDSSLQNYTVRLFCNHPLTSATPFFRKAYHELNWQCSSKMRLAFTDFFAEVVVTHAGNFNYYFTIDESANLSSASGQGFFVVDPVLTAGGQPLSLDGICMQTVITKLLGPFNEWESRLLVSKESGYNMIHFTPVQELGISNSAYCVRDQHRLSPVYSTDKRLTYLMMPHMKGLVEKMDKQWGVLSVADVVLNHTATDSPLLERHPDCAYNMLNTPHLRPAYVVDRILYHFNLEVAEHRWQHQQIPACLTESWHMDNMRRILHCEVFPKYRIPEFYQCDVEEIVKQCEDMIVGGRCEEPKSEELVLIQDPQYRRRKSTVDMNLAAYILMKSGHELQHGDGLGTRYIRSVTRVEFLDKGKEELRNQLQLLNCNKETEVWQDLCLAIDNFVSNGQYRFVDHHGPRLGHVSEDNPIMYHYFLCPESHKESVEKAEAMMNKEPQLVWAVNGFVYGDDPLRNFAEESQVYLRRELVPWVDTIKLRYGKCQEDNPVLWDFMKIYVEQTARVFHGFRIDNAHSTPLHVAEHMLDVARRQRRELFVLAELFVGDGSMERYFVNRLGINGIFKEVLNAHCQGELRGFVAEFSGEPLGSLIQPRVRELEPSSAPAVFYDQTHDNDTPMRFRSEFTMWPSAAVVAMTRCAVGSNRGYDELVPHHINVVTETRLYQRWVRDKNRNGEGADSSTGIIRGKRALNVLHRRLAEEGYTQLHTEDVIPGVVAITRYNPVTLKSVILVTSLIFQMPPDLNQKFFFNPLRIEGVVEEVVFEGNLIHNPRCNYKRNEKEINGLPSAGYFLDLQEHMHISYSNYCKEDFSEEEDRTIVFFNNFTPGTVVALQCAPTEKAKKALEGVHWGLSQYSSIFRSYTGDSSYKCKWQDSAFRKIAGRLSLSDLNRILYRVGVEEEGDGFGFSTYKIPNYGNLCYCGLRGVMSVLAEIRPQHKMGHPLCDNLRDGPWLMDYIVARFKVAGSTKPLADWLEVLFRHVKNLPPSVKPRYFDAVIAGTYVALREMGLQQFTPFVKLGSTFVQALALSCTQFLGYVRTAKLPPLSSKLTPTFRTETFLRSTRVEQAPVSLASGMETFLDLSACSCHSESACSCHSESEEEGLPYFAKEEWRSWGRDTFIALRGMMLITGRYADARCLILAYAGVLRHGLIPNLLWEGRDARFNCRDSVWWWLHGIKAYTLMVPNGESILQDPVLRLYPCDSTPATSDSSTDSEANNTEEQELSDPKKKNDNKGEQELSSPEKKNDDNEQQLSAPEKKNDDNEQLAAPEKKNDDNEQLSAPEKKNDDNEQLSAPEKKNDDKEQQLSAPEKKNDDKEQQLSAPKKKNDDKKKIDESKLLREQPLCAVMQEALSRHMAGVRFRERGAGPDLDPYMSDEGFNVEIGVHWPKGYVYGGSVHNCGTWMDFMGNSKEAGNLGKPATPRDGSAVEIVGLSYAVLSWLAEISQQRIYPYKGVRRSTPDCKDELITFEDWAENLKDNFEKDFYIGLTSNPVNDPHPECISRRGMYKDCLYATQVWTDYQLRPNVCVAMAVAPELFDDEHAWTALNLIQQELMGPVGMKTLDPKDLQYCGDYSVHSDCNDYKVAGGYNYHNGPEFLWLMPYFLRAKLYFASRREKVQAGVLKETVELTRSVLCRHYNLLFQSPWKSLPQLTNKDGAFCEDSCRAQAISSGCVLELLYDLERLGTAERPSIVDLQGPLSTGSCASPQSCQSASPQSCQSASPRP